MTHTERQADTAALRELLAQLDDAFYASIDAAAQLLKDTFAHSGKALVCGNGGSAAEAQHFSDEMLGRYRSNRRSYPVIALTADSMAITCIGNDFGFEYIFSRQVEALGSAGDILIALSTSGNSVNVLKAVDVAKSRNMKIIALTGSAGKLREIADIVIDGKSTNTARQQEVHLHAIHLLSEYFEET